MSENFSIKCFLSVFTVSVQLEEGDWFIYIYTRFTGVYVHVSLCTPLLIQKAGKYSYAVSDGSLP